jgi:hypothetical protein
MGNVRTRNTVARSRNNFAVETQKCNVCAVAELHAIVNYTEILNVAHNNVSLVNLCHLQNCKLYATVFERIPIQTNLQSF